MNEAPNSARLPQNRCLVRGFRQFSSHVKKRNACHGHASCTLTPLCSPDTAIRRKHETDRNSTDTYKVLRLPRKTKIDTSKKLRVPRHMIHMEVIC